MRKTMLYGGLPSRWVGVSLATPAFGPALTVSASNAARTANFGQGPCIMFNSRKSKAEQADEADRGRHPGFARHEGLAGGPGSLSLSLDGDFQFQPLSNPTESFGIALVRSCFRQVLQDLRRL